MITRTGLYPLGEGWRGNVRAKWTGEKRPPRKGEWFLSGAEVCAYQAFADMETPYHIAHVVKVRTVVVEVP